MEGTVWVAARSLASSFCRTGPDEYAENFGSCISVSFQRWRWGAE